MEINHNGKIIDICVIRVSRIGKFLGLMFRTPKTQNLLFEFPTPSTQAIHSFFVFFPFLALWLDRENNILECRIVRPFTPIIKPKVPAKRLLELPMNEKNSSILRTLLGEHGLNKEHPKDLIALAHLSL